MRFLFLLILCSVSLIASAQDFNSGITLGFAPTQVEGDALGGFDKYGISGSLFVNRDFSEKLMGQMDLKFIQKGSFDPNGTFLNYKIQLNYLEVPVTVFYRYKDRWLLGSGAAFGSLLSAKESNANGEFPTRIPFKKWEFSGHAAVNYLFNKRWSLGVRFSQSLLPIRPHVGNATLRYNRGQYNTVLDFTAGLQF